MVSEWRAALSMPGACRVQDIYGNPTQRRSRRESEVVKLIMTTSRSESSYRHARAMTPSR